MLHQLRAALVRAGELFRSRVRYAAEQDEEFSFHLEMETAENLRRGMSEPEARRAAILRFGGVQRFREETGDQRGLFEWLRQDVRVASRGLRRAPGFAAIAIVSLALGVGALTTMFSVVNAVVFRPLPYHDADRLVMIWTDDVRRGLHREATAWLTIDDWRRRSSSFDDVAYFSAGRINPISSDPQRGRGRTRHALVAANLFALLGAAPLHGRLISAGDEREQVAVISHSFWQGWFGGDSNVVGRTLVVEDGGENGRKALTVIGVLPREFWFPDRGTEVFTPAATYWRFDAESAERFQSWARRWTAVARLKGDVTHHDARTDLGRVGAQLAAVHTTAVPHFPGFATTVVPVLDTIAGTNLRSALWLLLGAVGVVLLVVCANLANLLLARGTSRQREFAVRRALGAGRGRLVRQLVVESMLLVLVGGTIGALIAAWATPVLGSAISAWVPRMDEVGFDSRVLWVALGASVLAGLVSGLVPALRLSSASAHEALRSGRTSRGRAVRRHQGLVVLAECALAMLLLASAGLLLRSLARVTSVDPGFDARGLITLRLEFPTQARQPAGGDAEATTVARAQQLGALAARVATVPGVTRAGFIDDMFISSQGNESIFIPGREPGSIPAGELAGGTVSPGFFEALRVPLRAGRFPNAADARIRARAMHNRVSTSQSLAEQELVAAAEPVVVNEAFAARFFRGQNPVGKRFVDNPTSRTRWFEIVGVVGDMRRAGPERAPIPEFWGALIPSGGSRVDLMVRTDGDPRTVAPLVRQAVIAEMPSVSVVNVSTAEQQFGAFTAQRRMQTSLLALFAAIALLLAAIGIFGLAHYAVAERAREIGVRMALGATPSGILRLMMAEGMRMPVAGIAIGAASSLAAGRLVQSQLFDIAGTDGVTIVAVMVLLGAVAAGACAVAAVRAARTDPAVVLRGE